jgi:zinc transporter ZupT
LLIAAITVHNFPEGLAVGVGFGSLPTSSSAAGVAGGSAAVTADAHKAFSAARSLAIGIGLQNIPEGLAVSLPLLRLGRGRLFSFFLGQLSGLFEVFAGLLGAAAVNLSTSVLPSSMAFAAGAMVFVVAEQLIPEANSGDSDHGDDSDHDHGHGDCGARVPRQGRFCAAVSRMRGGTLASLGLTVGFVVMMVMDVTL